MWILLVALWAAEPPVYAGMYGDKTTCEKMGYRVSQSYNQDTAIFRCIEVPK